MPIVVRPLGLGRELVQISENLVVDLRRHQMVGQKTLQRHLERTEDRERGEQGERHRRKRHERKHGGERQTAGHLGNAIFAAALRGELRETFKRIEVETHPGQQTLPPCFMNRVRLAPVAREPPVLRTQPL
jgi:hypothetical protein